MIGLGFAGLILGGIGAFLCLCAAIFLLIFEVSEWAENRLERRLAQHGLDEDAEVAALDACWDLPPATGSLPMRPARHSSNRLHRGF